LPAAAQRHFDIIVVHMGWCPVCGSAAIGMTAVPVPGEVRAHKLSCCASDRCALNGLRRERNAEHRGNEYTSRVGERPLAAERFALRPKSTVLVQKDRQGAPSRVGKEQQPPPKRLGLFRCPREQMLADNDLKRSEMTEPTTLRLRADGTIWPPRRCSVRCEAGSPAMDTRRGFSLDEGGYSSPYPTRTAVDTPGQGG